MASSRRPGRCRTVVLQRKPPLVVLQDVALYAQEVLCKVSQRLQSEDPLFRLVTEAVVRLATAADCAERQPDPPRLLRRRER